MESYSFVSKIQKVFDDSPTLRKEGMLWKVASSFHPDRTSEEVTLAHGEVALAQKIDQLLSEVRQQNSQRWKKKGLSSQSPFVKMGGQTITSPRKTLGSSLSMAENLWVRSEALRQKNKLLEFLTTNPQKEPSSANLSPSDCCACSGKYCQQNAAASQTRGSGNSNAFARTPPPPPEEVFCNRKIREIQPFATEANTERVGLSHLAAELQELRQALSLVTQQISTLTAKQRDIVRQTSKENNPPEWTERSLAKTSAPTATVSSKSDHVQTMKLLQQLQERVGGCQRLYSTPTFTETESSAPTYNDISRLQMLNPYSTIRSLQDQSFVWGLNEPSLKVDLAQTQPPDVLQGTKSEYETQPFPHKVAGYVHDSPSKLYYEDLKPCHQELEEISKLLRVQAQQLPNQHLVEDTFIEEKVHEKHAALTSANSHATPPLPEAEAPTNIEQKTQSCSAATIKSKELEVSSPVDAYHGYLAEGQNEKKEKMTYTHAACAAATAVETTECKSSQPPAGSFARNQVKAQTLKKLLTSFDDEIQEDSFEAEPTKRQEKNTKTNTEPAEDEFDF